MMTGSTTPGNVLRRRQHTSYEDVNIDPVFLSFGSAEYAEAGIL
jgi:hypothetical protein